MRQSEWGPLGEQPAHPANSESVHCLIHIFALVLHCYIEGHELPPEWPHAAVAHFTDHTRPTLTLETIHFHWKTLDINEEYVVRKLL